MHRIYTGEEKMTDIFRLLKKTGLKATEKSRIKDTEMRSTGIRQE